MSKSDPQLKPGTKSVVMIMFLTLFLDLVGFSIIFPLFPSLMEHYYRLDSQNFVLQWMLSLMSFLTEWAGSAKTATPIVLFGCILGAIYSLLQFIFAPFWGSLSDRIGRKPVLVISVTGVVVSYVLWFFSGSFTLFIVSRIIGGVMSANLSTATAVIGDVTDEKGRSRGMAIIGMAFGIGFVTGPALGGLISLVRLDLMFPTLTAYGVNPFSMPALLALVLAVVNLVLVLFFYHETLHAEKRRTAASFRTNNPFLLFKPISVPEISLINFANFFFLVGFSGMEFTITFLAVEKLLYTPMQNAYMFIYLGMLMAIVQGGYVRRKAHHVGEKNMAMTGIGLLIPGFLILAYTETTVLLYVSLTLMAVGAAMIMPCLTTLVSLYAPSEVQGRAIGTFRSLGALARVFGPFIAGIIYWRLGMGPAYLLGGLSLILPIALLARLKSMEKVQDSCLSPLS